MKYEVYYRRVSDGRAPERVSLVDEYRKAGIVLAETIRRVEHILLTQPDLTAKFVGGRQIMVGDIIIEAESRYARIYTPSGAWADVKLVG